jgi:hypothetical protein
VRLREAVEILLLVLAAVLGRRPRWHHAPVPFIEEAPLPFPHAPAPIRIRSIHDGTHLVCEHPILWVIGPGPNRGLRPRARAMPVPRPKIARAPPA